MRAPLIWGALAAAIAVPLGLAAQSPLLQWRDGIYIAGGFAGIIGLGLMLVQPVLVLRRRARWHRWLGLALVLAVLVHIGALWITSPPDVVDVLLLRSPTPFGIWGALAMWAVFAAAALALLRRHLPPRRWARLHSACVALAGIGTALHAVLIQGAMEPWSKAALCLAVLACTAMAVQRRNIWR